MNESKSIYNIYIYNIYYNIQNEAMLHYTQLGQPIKKIYLSEESHKMLLDELRPMAPLQGAGVNYIDKLSLFVVKDYVDIEVDASLKDWEIKMVLTNDHEFKRFI